ncbi:MAG: zinc ribbon domain-containing protein [Deltaproteobacteria bacterium]|nr:zinc ribbon domain-containing protein [Deltaproteobacteria bacterium]
MEKQQIWGFSGCALLLGGCFAPLLSAGSHSVCFFDLPFYYKGMLLAMIGFSAYLVWRKDYKPLLLPAMVVLLLVLSKFMDALNLPAMVDLSYGWLVLLAGIGVLFKASSFRWRDGLGALIPRDLSGGAGLRPGPPPLGAMAPPPPPGAMPPPPPPIPSAPLTSGAAICPHCRAPLSPTAKFCRACGSPVTQAAAPPMAVPPAGLTCPHCQATLTATAKFCRACGAPVPPGTAGPKVACPRCGASLEPDERFCSTCGQAIPQG